MKNNNVGANFVRPGNKGITLIALIITIIIMLILVAVTVSYGVKSGLLSKAKEAKVLYIVEQEKESIENVKQGYLIEEKSENLNGKTFVQYMQMHIIKGTSLTKIDDNTVKIKFIESGNEYEVEKDKIKLIKNNNENEKKSLYEMYKEGNLKIGDYVAYVPNANSTYTISEEDTLVEEQKIIAQNFTWRFLGIDNQNNILLVSSAPTNSSIKFSFDIYSSFESLLDDICNELYSDVEKGVVARNLRFEDISNGVNDSALSDIKDEDEFLSYNVPSVLLEHQSGSFILSTYFVSTDLDIGGNDCALTIDLNKGKLSYIILHSEDVWFEFRVSDICCF